VIVVKPSLYALIYLCENARPDEIVQHQAIVGRVWNPDDVANDHYNRRGVKFMLVGDDHVPIVAGGWDPVIEGVWHGWLVGTMVGWEKHWISITKECRRIMDSMLDKGARRLQFSAITSRQQACKWYADGLKMQPEGVQRNYGFNGEDIVMYARVKERDHGRQ
jgi:hypothetical protein